MRGLLFISIFLGWQITFASGENFGVGGRQAGMGFASATLQDVFALSNNPAGIAHLETMHIGLYGDQRYITGIQFYNLSVVAPVQKVGAFGVSLDYFGFSAYNESKIGLAYGRKFGEKVSAGLKFNYLRLAIEENGAAHAFAFDAGIQIQPTKKMRIAAHIYNPVRQIIDKEWSETLATAIRLGVSYHPSQKLILALEAEKYINYQFRLKSGMEYKVAEPFFVRLGGATNPTVFTFGVGTAIKNLQLDFSTSWHLQLGFTPHVSFVYAFPPKKNE